MSIPSTESHKTAIRRAGLSRPLKTALRDQVFREGDSFFDYGCGHGDDITLLRQMGYDSEGWDPAHRDGIKPSPADAVNIGYVINVIENQQARALALRKAFELSRRTLVVSALTDMYFDPPVNSRKHGDGYVTSKNTFQRVFSQTELKVYIEGVLGIEAFPAAPGIFYVFKDARRKEDFLECRTRRTRLIARRKLTIAERYAPHKELLEAFVSSIYRLGRIPLKEEFEQALELNQKIGSFKKAYTIVQHVFPNNDIIEYRRQRRDDLLVYLAMSNFRKLPKAIDMSPSALHDLKSFFGGYRKAKVLGRDLLFKTGDPKNIIAACRRSKIGKQLPDDLYAHVDCVEKLSPVLRIYVACAQAVIGDIDDANIVKIHMRLGKVSYLKYRNFERDPHPALISSTTVMLRKVRVRHRDYSGSDNPPILHRKESFVDKDHPAYHRFAKLTRAEETAGLFYDMWKVGLKKPWEQRLIDRGFKLRGHTLLAQGPALC